MPETGETTTRRPRRNHTAAFKAKVALAAIRGEQTLVVLFIPAIRCPRQPDQAMERATPGGSDGRFGGEANTEAASPTVDINTLHAKIGEPALENVFLSGALGKAGLPGGKK